jgi:hypothetical protein
MITLSTILLIAALIVFIISTFNVPARFNLIGAGLALWVLAEIIQKINVQMGS